MYHIITMDHVIMSDFICHHEIRAKGVYKYESYSNNPQNRPLTDF